MIQATVKLVSLTPRAEETVAYCARVSHPANQENPEIAGLLSYCIRHGHWSIFEQANLILEISTSRAISAQILRHRSFSFQEFSQRYAEAGDYVAHHARRQARTNRQSSVDDLSPETQAWFLRVQEDNWNRAFAAYQEALALGIARESARSLLPLSTATRLYMNGTIRSWIHYFQLRCQPETQREHRQIAEAGREIFTQNFPVVSQALGWGRADAAKEIGASP